MFNDTSKNALARGTPEYHKSYPRVRQHPG